MRVLKTSTGEKMEMEARKTSKKSGGLAMAALRMLLNVVVHFMVGSIVFFVIFLALYFITNQATDPVNQFHLHITFSVIGYQLLMVEAVLTYSRDGPMSSALPRQAKRVVHLILASLGVVSSVVGASLAMIAHGALFDTAHGICGLTAMIFSLISCVNGTLSFFSPQLRDRMSPSTIKAVHTVCGCVAVTMGLVTLCLGLNKPDLTVAIIGRPASTCLTIFVAAVLLYVLVAPAISFLGYAKNMRSTAL